MLDAWGGSRHGDFYYTGLNFGMVEVDEGGRVDVKVFDEVGEVVGSLEIQEVVGGNVEEVVLIRGERKRWLLVLATLLSLLLYVLIKAVRTKDTAKSEDTPEDTVVSEPTESYEEETLRIRNEALEMLRDCKCNDSFVPQFLLKGGAGGAFDVLKLGGGVGCFKCK